MTAATRADDEAPDQPDGLDRDALARFLAEVGVETAGPLEATLISGGRSNLTFRVTDGVRRWVLRRPPLGQIPRGAHDVGREHRVMAALAGSAVPVPEVAALCAGDSVLGAPFYLMVEVPGTVLRSREQVALLDPERCRLLGRSLVDTLADLHDIDPASVGLVDLGRADGYLERQVARWQRQYQEIKVRDLPGLEEVGAVLERRIPVSGPAAIVHGDYRLDNVIVDSVDSPEIAAVLDWEMATLGDPLADLAALVMFWDEPGQPFNPITKGLMAFEGFPSTGEIVEQYAERRGLGLEEMDWYLTFARFRLAVILEQIHARYLRGETSGEGFDDIGDMVPPLVEQCLETIASMPSRHTARTNTERVV